VLAAIDFKDEPLLKATKIDHVSTDGPLPFEFEAAEATVAHAVTDESFGWCHSTPERPCVRAH
jgi:hypothetical protein